MVDPDAGDQSTIGVNYINGVQTPSQANFQNCPLNPCPRQDVYCRQGAKFIIGQLNITAGILYPRKRVTQHLINHHRPVDSDYGGITAVRATSARELESGRYLAARPTQN